MAKNSKTAKQAFQVMIAGRVWYSPLTEDKATAEAIRARQLGYGMAYVERIDRPARKSRKAGN